MTKTEQLARAFSAVLLEWLGPEKLREVVSRNLRNATPGVCHSHDFCDANMAMEEAFEKLGIQTPVDGPTDDEATDLWNAAWEIAYLSSFWVPYPARRPLDEIVKEARRTELAKRRPLDEIVADDELSRAAEIVNSAETPAERSALKTLLSPQLYGSPRKIR